MDLETATSEPARIRAFLAHQGAEKSRIAKGTSLDDSINGANSGICVSSLKTHDWGLPLSKDAAPYALFGGLTGLGLLVFGTGAVNGNRKRPYNGPQGGDGPRPYNRPPKKTRSTAPKKGKELLKAIPGQKKK